MPTQVIMPQLGESVVEGTVSKWLKVEGQSVNEFEPLLEVNTDKVDTEIPVAGQRRTAANRRARRSDGAGRDGAGDDRGRRRGRAGRTRGGAGGPSSVAGHGAGIHSASPASGAGHTGRRWFHLARRGQDRRRVSGRFVASARHGDGRAHHQEGRPGACSRPSSGGVHCPGVGTAGLGGALPPDGGSFRPADSCVDARPGPGAPSRLGPAPDRRAHAALPPHQPARDDRDGGRPQPGGRASPGPQGDLRPRGGRPDLQRLFRRRRRGGAQSGAVGQRFMERRGDRPASTGSYRRGGVARRARVDRAGDSGRRPEIAAGDRRRHQGPGDAAHGRGSSSRTRCRGAPSPSPIMA